MGRFQFFLPDRRLTDRRLTDKTDCLTPLRACARGGVIMGCRLLIMGNETLTEHNVQVPTHCTSAMNLLNE